MIPGLLNWRFGDLEPNAYRVVLADPPWQFKLFSAKGEGKSPQAHYATQHLGWIKSLPVADLAHPEGCALFLWGTAPMMPHALEAMAAWGFSYRSMGAWAKQSSTGARWAFGPGYLFRSAAEFFLLGVRGKPHQHSRSVRNLVVAPVREHSRKPDAFRTQVVEALFPGPYAELFARQAAPGWAAWGNETDKFNPPGDAGPTEELPSYEPAID